MLNDLFNKLKINRMALHTLYFIYIFFFFWPDFWQFLIVKIMNYSLLAIFGFFVLTDNYKCSKMAMYTIVFMFVGILISFYHQIPNANFMLIMHSLRQLGLVVFTDYMLQKNRDKVIEGSFFVLSFWIGLSVLAVFIYPEGLSITYDSNGWATWVTSVNWLYGHKNNHALTFMLFQLFVWLAYEYKIISLNKKYCFCLTLMPFLASLIMRSTTTSLASLIVVIGLAIGFNIWQQGVPRLKIEYVMAAYLGIIVFYGLLNLEYIRNLLGFDYEKYISFTGRNYIWGRVIELIPQNLLLGIGLIDFNTSIKLLGNKFFCHAHNTFLDVLWKGGVVYLSMFLSLVYSLYSDLKKPLDTRISNLLISYFCALLIEMSMESYLQEGKIFLLFFLLAYVADNNKYTRLPKYM